MLGSHLPGKRHTWEVALTFFPLGWLAWGWFFIVAHRAGRKRWNWFGVLWLATTASQVWLSTVIDGTSDAFGGYLLATWIGGIIVGFVLRARYEARFRPPRPVVARYPAPAGGPFPPYWPALTPPPGRTAEPAGAAGPQPRRGGVGGTVLAVFYLGAMSIVLIAGIVITVQAIQTEGYSHSRLCGPDAPLSRHGCLHLVPVILHGSSVHVQVNRVGTTRDLSVDVRNGDFRPQVLLGANANWSAVRQVPAGTPLIARFYDGRVMALDLPGGRQVSTEDTPSAQLTMGLTLVGIPVGALALIFLVVKSVGLTTSRSRLRRHAGRLLQNLVGLAVIVATVAINGYLGGWHQAIVFGVGSVIVVEVISVVIRLMSRRHHAARGPAQQA